MAQLQPVDRQTFLANLRQSGLLEEREIAAVADQLPEDAKSKHVARALMNRGLLTKFQAERLLSGRPTAFVLGQYRILDKLGRGGMGHVYKAEHRTMNRVVALKVLSPKLIQSDRAQDLFLREVRAVARLVHANIVTAFDANRMGDRYYLVLEYVNGPNLDQLVRQQGPLPVGVACDFVRQVALGLQYAHEQGMVHRDIKPANILIQKDARTGQGAVKISDFGLARLQEADTTEDVGMGTILTKENTVMGTPDFLSPEQARNLHHVDIRSDLYSLGCTFYYLLTGKVPFPGGTTLEKLIRHTTEAPEPVDKLRPELPADVTTIVERLMAKDPGDRFQTPAQLAAALEPLVAKDSGGWSTARPERFPSGEGDPQDAVAAAGSDSEIESISSVEAALAGTLLPDLSPTPISTGIIASTSRISRQVHREQRRRFRFAFLLSTIVVGGLISLLALLGFLLGH